jgi:hypothetical protein
MGLEPRFDIFRKESDGNVLWIDSAETLSGAVEKAREAMTVRRATYFVISRTGDKVVVSPDEMRSASE